MKREVERERKVPAFFISVGDLEVLCNRIISLFKESEEVYISIHVTLPKEKLEFNNIEEFKEYNGLKGKVTDFTLWFSQSGSRISIRANSSLYSQAEISASSETEAWCAGAIETVYSFLHSHKVWYHWLASAPLGWLLFLIMNVPTIMKWSLPEIKSFDNIAIIAWFATLVPLVFLYLFRKKLFPTAVLCISEEEGTVRRYSAEIGLVIALISIVLTIVGWFVNK